MADSVEELDSTLVLSDAEVELFGSVELADDSASDDDDSLLLAESLTDEPTILVESELDSVESDPVESDPVESDPVEADESVELTIGVDPLPSSPDPS